MPGAKLKCEFANLNWCFVAVSKWKEHALKWEEPLIAAYAKNTETKMGYDRNDSCRKMTQRKAKPNDLRMLSSWYNAKTKKKTIQKQDSPETDNRFERKK